MKKNKELEEEDIAIDREMDFDCANGIQIVCYVETWFDINKKFNVHTNAEEGTWVNMYAKYDPFKDTLGIECVLSSDSGTQPFPYSPTSAESELIKRMITQKIWEENKQTPREFCEAYLADVNEQQNKEVSK